MKIKKLGLTALALAVMSVVVCVPQAAGNSTKAEFSAVTGIQPVQACADDYSILDCCDLEA